ncbi:transcription antitermination factor NusB [Bryobacter aggregatus]|uniref:transcription antitermination factor NusB n=1 Tax=Bryobacter aggregatus TaxID=360054 RepID=UPI0004E25C64|nr:transcription antitermination factor NusB [Bryobacter aggregatus]
MASRRKSRERALQVLYVCDLRKQDPDAAIEAYYQTLHSEDDDFSRLLRDRFMEELVRGAIAKKDILDEQIGKASEHWRLDRMPSVDRNILRLAAFELYEGKLPYAVIIDEALELARRYSGDESVKFVNGVLDSIKASSEKPAAKTSLTNTKS